MMTIRYNLLPLFLLLLLFPGSVRAHQPRLVDQPVVSVSAPEISQAYYGTLTGAPQAFSVSSPIPFNLYLSLLVPDLKGQNTDFSALVIKKGPPDSRAYALLNGMNVEWSRFWEPFGADAYLKGPELEMEAEAGDYEIQVHSTMNQGKYVLVIGKIEAFDAKEAQNALHLIPVLKQDFFETSPILFLRSPLSWGYLIIVLISVLVIGFLAHTVVRMILKKKWHRPLYRLAPEHRLLVAGFGLVLLLWAVATTWHPLVLFFAGTCLFEASGLSSLPSIILSRKK